MNKLANIKTSMRHVKKSYQHLDLEAHFLDENPRKALAHQVAAKAHCTASKFWTAHAKDAENYSIKARNLTRLAMK